MLVSTASMIQRKSLCCNLINEPTYLYFMQYFLQFWLYYLDVNFFASLRITDDADVTYILFVGAPCTRAYISQNHCLVSKSAIAWLFIPLPSDGHFLINIGAATFWSTACRIGNFSHISILHNETRDGITIPTSTLDLAFRDNDLNENDADR